MRPSVLATELRDRGLELHPAGDHIRVRGPEELLTAEVQEQVREHKPRLLPYLKIQRECDRLRDRIEAAAPVAVRHAPLDSELVVKPTDRFLDALGAWLENDCPRSRRELRHAAGEVVRAWREAGRRFEAEGRPGSWKAMPT